jgi:hypothetical protein
MDEQTLAKMAIDGPRGIRGFVVGNLASTRRFDYQDGNLGLP